MFNNTRFNAYIAKSNNKDFVIAGFLDVWDAVEFYLEFNLEDLRYCIYNKDGNLICPKTAKELEPLQRSATPSS